MRSRSTVNIIMGVAIIILAVIALFEPGIEKNIGSPLLHVDSASITRIEINREKRSNIVLENIKNRWLMTQPLQIPADPKIVKQLLQIPEFTSQAVYRVKAHELAKYGLDKPTIELKLNKQTLSFGGIDPINSRRYVGVDQKLKLVTDTFYHHLIAAASHFAVKE